MTWRVLFAAQLGTVRDADLSIEAGGAGGRGRGGHGPVHVRGGGGGAGASADGLLTLGDWTGSGKRCSGCPTAGRSSASVMVSTTSISPPRPSLAYRCPTPTSATRMSPTTRCCCCSPARASSMPLHQELSVGHWRRDLLVGYPADLWSDARADWIRPHRVRGGSTRTQAIGLEVVAVDPFVDDQTLAARASAAWRSTSC